jgi:serine/threonine-protein kinase
VNILMAHVHEDVPLMATHNVEVHSALEGLVRRAMAKAPADRFASMDDMLAALTSVASEQGLAVSRSGDLGISGEFGVGSGSTTLSRSDILSSGSQDPSLDSLGGLVSSSDAQARRGTVKWGLLIGLLCLSIAAVAFVLIRSSTSAVAPVAAVAVPTAPAPDADAHADDAAGGAAPGVQTTRVTIVSEPPGAQVRIGDTEIVRTTPATFTWSGEQARRGRSVTFRFQLEGYRDLNAVRTVVGREMHVSGRLEPIDSEQDRARRPPTTSRTPPASGTMQGSESSVGLMGYKLEPY